MTSTSTGHPKLNLKSPTGPAPRLLMAAAKLRVESCDGRTTHTLLHPPVRSAAPSALTRCQPPWTTSFSGPDCRLWTPTAHDEQFYISCCPGCHVENRSVNVYVAFCCCLSEALIQGKLKNTRISMGLCFHSLTYCMSGWNRKLEHNVEVCKVSVLA